MTTTFEIGGDLLVQRLGFGAMRITGDGIWGWPSDERGAVALLHRVREIGVNLIDTSDAYGPETSEYLIARALKPYGNVVVATKGGLERGGPQEWSTNGRPEHLKIACKNSCRRLEVDQIDLYQLHAIDDDVPLEESIGALKDLQDAGFIKHIGVSNFKVDELERARKIVEVVSVQNRYNLADRTHDPVVDYCAKHNIGFIPWYPIATGSFGDHGPLAEIARRYDATPHQIALAWLLKRSPTMLPIPGTSSIAHLEQNTAAREIELTDADFEALTALH